MGYSTVVQLICFLFCYFNVGISQLQSSQIEVLLQLKKQLEYPWPLEIWKDHGTNFCSLTSFTSQVNVTCQDNVVTELSIVGDRQVTIREFNGYAIKNQTLSESFSMDSFVSTLARLNGLKVLRLVSLGIWGSLPDKIHRLSMLQHLDLSSNFIFGSVPPKICTMLSLRNLTSGDNFFNGTVPDCFDSLTNLTVLNLRNNHLEGPFPSSLTSIYTLTTLVLSGNEISGRLPDFSGLKNLQLIDLSGNRLQSELPSLPRGLLMVILRNNSFTEEIPQLYAQMSRLQHLDVSFNELTGTPPADLFSLPNMSYLNFASNLLSGSLSGRLSCSSRLNFVDISNNKFRGSLPDCLGTRSENKVVKFDGNCLSTNKQYQHAVSFCMEIHMEKKQSRVGNLIGLMVGIVVIIVLLGLGSIVLCQRYCTRGISEQHLLQKAVQDQSAPGFSSELLNNARFIYEASKLRKQDFPMYRSFSHEELKEATNNFKDSALMGESLYGKLYRGKLANGTQVAIRCLPMSKKYSLRNFKLRLDLLAKLRHPHLVCLLGHCIESVGPDDRSARSLFLISEYVPNGSFCTYLSGATPGKAFNWSERLTVLISTAKAVHFLHTGMIPGFFSNRLKTNNILLDEHGTAKLSDYGLSIISEEAEKSGLRAESPRSRQMARLEDDVYSFGFIVLEALVGPSVSARMEPYLMKALASLNNEEGWNQTVDPIVLATSCRESLSIVISITNKSISPESWSRPSIEDVLWNLQYAAQVQATADGDQRFDSASH